MRDLTIVIPVFNAVEETLACLRSLLDSDAGRASIVVLDDGSIGRVADHLSQEVSAHDNVRVVGHFRNRGYTRNVAFGVASAETRYVCVLNSDTLLPKVWAGPMVAEMEANPVVAAIGPLSNAASYQTVPELYDPQEGGWSVNEGLGFDPLEREAVTAFVKSAFAELLVDVPILNGFCTIFRRSALERAGGFDWASFPEGYGEENDVCIRLRAGGSRLMVKPGCFVHHQKSKSFGTDRKRSLSQKGREVLAKKYGPTLVVSYGAQMKDDPVLRLVRLRVATWRAQSGDGRAVRRLSGPARLAFDPSGTGAPTHAPLPAEQATNLSVRLGAQGPLEITLPEGFDLPVLEGAPLLSALQALAQLSHANVVSLFDWMPEALPETLRAAMSELPFGMLIHDHAMLTSSG